MVAWCQEAPSSDLWEQFLRKISPHFIEIYSHFYAFVVWETVTSVFHKQGHFWTPVTKRNYFTFCHDNILAIFSLFHFLFFFLSFFLKKSHLIIFRNSRVFIFQILIIEESCISFFQYSSTDGCCLSVWLFYICVCVHFNGREYLSRPSIVALPIGTKQIHETFSFQFHGFERLFDLVFSLSPYICILTRYKN